MALLLIFGPVRDLNASVAALYCTYRWCYATTALSHLGTFGEDSALSVLDRKELNGRFPFSCFLRMSSRLKKIIKRCEPAINLTATYKNKTKQKSGSVEVDITGSSSSRTTAEEARSGRTELSLQIQYSNSSFFPPEDKSVQAPLDPRPLQPRSGQRHISAKCTHNRLPDKQRGGEKVC